MPLMMSPFSKYATFHGRATRAEYFGFTVFVLFIVLLLVLLTFVPAFAERDDMQTALFALMAIVVLGSMMPTWAVGVRRLHDRGLSGWWQLVSFIPYVGGLVWLVLVSLPGTPGENRYGGNLKGSAGVPRD